ncbi:MAG: SGNH/GDSL hydrolase family protein, partial [Planctomycetes bacterium]|nr:SGNH/GDSL hydrolase family protein [Planctomycetota bacterium]
PASPTVNPASPTANPTTPTANPATPTARPRTSLTHNNDSAYSQQDTPFTAVKNGAKKTPKSFLPVTTIYNKFQILAEPVDEAHETLLIGDSIIRGQLDEFCGRAPIKRKRFCIPGAGLDDVLAAKEDITKDVNDNSLLVFHVGTNDVMRTRSEELLEKYRKLIQQYKLKTNNIIISGVLPRMSAESSFYSKAFSLNSRIKSLCLQEGIGFMDSWNQFYQKPDLFMSDGLHLNSVGSARLGRLLSNAVTSFRSKNGVRQPSTDPPT